MQDQIPENTSFTYKGFDVEFVNGNYVVYGYVGDYCFEAFTPEEAMQLIDNEVTMMI